MCELLLCLIHTPSQVLHLAKQLTVCHRKTRRLQLLVLLFFQQLILFARKTTALLGQPQL